LEIFLLAPDRRMAEPNDRVDCEAMPITRGGDRPSFPVSSGEPFREEKVVLEPVPRLCGCNEWKTADGGEVAKRVNK
jgi:hypothetical protein